MRNKMRGKKDESLLLRGDLHKIINKVNFKVAEHIFFSVFTHFLHRTRCIPLR